ncbi:MAG: gamma-glutamyl-gamma-aminobutyrate hydrolase family protein [bacterium]
MPTLLVNCYPPSWQDRLGAYLDLLGRFGPVRVATVEELGAGPEDAAAVVLTGSPLMLATDPPPAGLVEFVRGLRVPVFGICFGHQLLGIATGAKMGRREFFEGPGLIRVRAAEPLFAGMEETLVVAESHAEYLEPDSAAAAGWDILADSRWCAVEAMRHRERPWYGVQFHPERSGRVGVEVLANFYRHAVRA